MPVDAEAGEPPEIAVLTALAHGRDAAHGRDLVRRALIALGLLRNADPSAARLYFDLLAFKMKEQVRAAMEEMMPEGQQFMSDWMREAEAKGIERGIEQGIERGIEQGIERGIEQGTADGARRALHTILRVRGVALTPADDERVAACNDAERLERWIARAVTATAASDVFAVRDPNGGEPPARG